MENVPPPAEELAILDRELSLLEARRAQLLTRRAWLLNAMQSRVTAPTAPPPPETSPPNVQNVLLFLGGILLTIAAIAFTLVSWGHLGIGGRSAVLGAVTVATLATPVALLRRGLVSTAESVAALGLVLMVLDAYALHRVALPEADGLGYAASASAALAALWSAYGMSLGRLRIPLPVAVLTAQLPLPLWALTAGPGAPPMEWALLATAALDVAVALWTKPAAVRAVAGTGATITGGVALLIGGRQSVTADTPLDAAGPAVLLLTTAAVALLAAWRAPSAAVAASAVAGLTVIAAVGGVVRAGVPGGWAVLGYLLCAVALLAVVRLHLPHGVTRGLTGAAAAVHVAAVISALPLVALTLMGPVTQLDDIWSGTPADASDLLGSGLTSAPVVLLVVSMVLAAVSRWSSAAPESPRATAPSAGPQGAPAARPDPTQATSAPTGTSRPGAPEGAAGPAGPAGMTAHHTGRPDEDSIGPAGESSTAGHPTARPAGTGTPAAGGRVIAAGAVLGLAWAGLLVLPPALDLGHAAAVTLHLLLTTAVLALVVAMRPRIGPHAVTATALACGLAGAVSVALLALATRPATFAVLGTLVAVLAAAALAARAPAQAVLACAATAFATGLVGAGAALAELPPHRAALMVLAVTAAVALLGARLGRHPVALPLELTGAAAGLLAVGLAAQDMPTLALVLALSGVIAAGTAVRAERRPAAGYVAAVLFVLATWVRLAASDVASPEAYTLPVTVPALVVGVLRRRRDPEASSWTAYGPGLAATLLPSLIAAWGDEHWLRPLLLGVAALAITLAGARLRLQALLVLGGTVLSLDALHELAPYVVQVVGVLPRWLPPALAGLLLLAVGATYEQRLRDARKLRDALGRMR